MEIQKIYPVTQYMLLGRCGDNNVKQIWINVRQWLQEVPSGQFQLMIYPPQGDVYPAPTVLEDGILKWTITDADTAIVGDGQAQLTMYGADGEVARQRTIGTRVLESKAGRESGEIPDHITPWVDTISTMSTQAKRAAAQAKASQSIVQEYSQQAQAAVDDAVAAKNSAEASKVAAESARDSAQNYAADAQAAKATAQAAASEAQDAKYAAQSAKTLAEGAKSQAIGAKLEAQYAQQHAVAAKDAAVQAQLSAQGYATTAQTAASSANTANSQAQSAKTDAVQAKQAAQEALQQLKEGIRTGDFKGEKGDTPVITSERSGNVTTIRSDGVAVAQILDGQDGDAGFSPSVSVTKNNKVTTIRITDKDGVHTATINDGEDGSDATVTKQSIEAALSYVPANDATAMVYKQVIFDGTKFTDDAGTQLTFSQLKTLCLDHKHFVYCTYENDLYIPQHVQPTQIYFDATYIRNHQVEIHRVGININGSVNQQVVYPQEKLVSGTNIKTINNESILGSGDIHIVGGGDIVQNPDDEYEGVVVPSTLADVDPTLTVHGDAADAGVVGQQIAQIKDDISALPRYTIDAKGNLVITMRDIET